MARDSHSRRPSSTDRGRRPLIWARGVCTARTNRDLRDRPRPATHLAVFAALAACAMALLPGCSWVQRYRSRVSAEEAFAEGARAAERSDLALADEKFAEALRLEPGSAGLRARVGMAYMAMRPAQPARALPYLRRSLRLEPNQPAPVYLDAVLAAARLGRDDWARQVLARARMRFRNDPMALNDIGYLLADADKLTAEALPLLQRAVELAPKSGIIIDSLGWAHCRLGDMQRAADLLEQASDLAPGNTEIEYHLGAAYAALGRTVEARRQFNRALELNPEFAPARRALEELEGDGGRR